MTRLATLFAGAVLAACATDLPPGAKTEFDESAGVVEVTALGDGFVRFRGERVPLEAAVLTLRQRARAMTRDERARFVVQLLAAPNAADEATKQRTARDLDRLLNEVQIMGFPQARYL